MSIPEAELARLKRDISIVRLVEAHGVKLSGQGDNLIGLCPLHPDKSPSLVLSPAKNVWHCLGACQKGGSVIDWVMCAKRVSFRLAVEMLRKEDPSLVVKRSVASTKPKLEPIAVPDEADALILARVVDYYHRTLKESPEALAYLEKRGLTHPELIDHFRLGYANRTLGYRLPTQHAQAGAALRGQLQRIGLYRESGHEHLSGSLTIPVLDEAGEVREVYGRKIRDNLRVGTPLHLYLPSRPDGRRGVFNWPAFQAEREIILCEALIDALTFWCAGFRNVTSSYGVEGFTEELAAAMKAHQTAKVLIAYDRDEAGNRAAEKLAAELGRTGVEVFRVLFPKGMDANEYACTVKPAARSFEAAIRGAMWMAGTRPVAVPEAIAEEPLEEEAPLVPEPGPECGVSAAPVAEEGPEPEASPEPELEAPPAPEAKPAPKPEAKREPEPRPAPKPAPRAEPSKGELDMEVRGEELRIVIGDRRWRIRGLHKNTSYESLRLNLLVARGDTFFVDTPELYSSRQRGAFLKEASTELKVDELILKSDLGRILLRVEDLVHEQIEAVLETEPKVEMSEEERREALGLLRDPKLLEHIVSDFDKAGVVGEETNLLIGYLAAVSRKLEAPLAIVVQSSSAAGKSSLMDAVLRFIPEEDRVQFSAMTGQALYYLGEHDLEHRVLAIAEEEGAESASYALKLLQSEHELTIASTGKDATGKLVTIPYRVKGPVMIFLTTTAIEVDEELLNRCIVVTVDESAKQTSAIHARQREAQTLDGLLLRRERDVVAKIHQNAQRLLEPVFVTNPFAKSLRFESSRTRTRRDHMKYLTLIRAIALLHQHQRPVKEIEHRGERVRYIEVVREDIEVADRLAKVVLKNCLDEMPPQTRALLGEIDEMVTAMAKSLGIERAAVRFTRRDIRERTRLSLTQLRVHVGRLEELEYLLIHAGGGKRRFVYELALEAGASNVAYDSNLAGSEGDLAGGWRPHGGVGARQDKSSSAPANPEHGGVAPPARLRSPPKNKTYATVNGRSRS